MNNQFFFIDSERRTIEGKQFIVIYILEFNKKQIFKIYKSFDNNLIDKLNELDIFDDISNDITFAIKRDAKISLDIKL